MDRDNTIQEHLVYPGNYQPAEGRDMPVSAGRRSDSKLLYPMVNVMEQPHLVKVELLLPGFRREDFFVRCRERKLFVYAMPNTGSMNTPAAEFAWQIDLPSDVDVAFVSAEYNDGLLRFHFIKSKCAEAIENHEIVVY